MPEAVECSECGSSYDSERHPFCPRCGSTARGAALPGAVASAARRAPGRRRVQASGVVLLAIGVLFLVSAIAGLLVSIEDAARTMDADDLSRWPGGEVVVRFPGGGNGTARLVDSDGAERARANATGAAQVSLDAAEPRMTLLATQGGSAWNVTVLVISGDRLTVDLDDTAPDGAVVVGPSMKAALAAGAYIALAVAAVLLVGGACAAVLRLFPLAAIAAGTAGFMALFAIVVLLAVGLLFAVPLGMAAYFILRGRRHFHRREPMPPPGAPPVPPAPPSP